MRRLLSPLKGPGSHNASIDENYYRIRETFASERLFEEVSTPIPLDFSSFLAKKFAAGSIKGSIFTLICSTLGTGLLLMPNAIAESGIIWGVVQIILCAFLSHYSLIILVKCGEGFGAFSYQALAEITFGKWYKQLVNIVFFLTCWGASIAILIMTSQLVAKACENLSDPNTLPNWMTDPFSKIWPILIATLIVLPLSLPKELKQLRYICLLSFFFVVVLAGIVLYESFVWNDVSANFHATKLVVPQGFTNTFATAIFAFACHPNALDIFKELQYANERRMKKVINRSLIITAATYFVIGVFGYFTFAATAHILTDTHLANGIILFAYGYYDSGASRSYPIIVDIGLVLIGISLVITLPMCIKPAKESIEEMFCSRLAEGTKWEKIRHFILTICTVYSAVGVGIFVKSIPDLINVLASSLLSLMCFVMPATFYLKLREGEPFKGHKLACLILVIVSLIFGTYATVINLIELMNANGTKISSL